jgi:pimeloyl-ACP methyl ester carboxylesterase
MHDDVAVVQFAVAAGSGLNEGVLMEHVHESNAENLCCAPVDAPCPFVRSPSELPSITLAEARVRFEREAISGVCDTGRYRSQYYVWGVGPPIVMIPGIADDRLSFILVGALLAPHFRCIAYDLPSGAGDGARLRHIGHPQLVHGLFALLDHLAIPKSYLFGSSFGGTITLAAMHARPERFPRAVLQGAFAHRPLGPAESFLSRLGRYWPGTMHLLPGRTALLQRFHSAPFASRPQEIWSYFLERSNTHPIAAVAHRALLIHRLDLRPILSTIRQPVLMVCGDNDPLVGRACEEALLGGLAGAGRATITGCGHNPLFSHPETLAELVRQFLTPPVVQERDKFLMKS